MHGLAQSGRFRGGCRDLKRLDNIYDSIPLELRLVLAGASRDTAKIEYLLQRPLNWVLFLRLAEYHRVYPLVYKTLGQLYSGDIPGNVIEYLHQKHRENTLHALNMAGETIRLVNVLEGNGVPVVVLKGTPLASHLYGDVASRPSNDIDILVSLDNLDFACRTLESEGYQKAYPELDLTPRQLEIYTRTFIHHIVFWHSKRNTLVEIHWHLGDGRQILLPFPVGSKIQRIQVAGSLIPVLADEDWLLYLIFHGASHAWIHLRWLVDIDKFMQRGINWDNIYVSAQSTGMLSLLAQSQILVERLVAVPFKTDNSHLNAVGNLRAWKLSCLATYLCLLLSGCEVGERNSKRDSLVKYIYEFQILVGLRNRLNYVLRLLSPSISDIKLVSWPDNLYYLYYITRPFTLLYRNIWGTCKRTK